MMATIMDGNLIANDIHENNLLQANHLIEVGVQPKLAFIRVGNDPGSVGYHQSAQKKADQNMIASESFVYDKDIEEASFLKAFSEINKRTDIHGILVLRPLPDHLSFEKISHEIDPAKDVDGMNPFNIGKSFSPDKMDFVPITPYSVMQMLDYYAIPLRGKEVVIVGHSLVVGRPLSMMLVDRGATVTICHIDTKNTQAHTKQADIVISATGKRGLITKDHVKEGVVVVDVGTSYDENGKVHGDVRFDEVKELASYINPVPGGIGAITSETLCGRVVQSAKMSTESEYII